MYQNSYIAQQESKRRKVFIAIYGILIFLSLSLGIAFRVQNARVIKDKAPEASSGTYSCIFCPSDQSDPLYKSVPDPALVYCKAGTTYIPMNEKYFSTGKAVKIKYTYDGETTVLRETDENGLAKYGSQLWSNSSLNAVKLVRELDTSTIPSTVTYNGVTYKITGGPNQSTCSASVLNIPLAFLPKGTVAKPATPSQPCCTKNANGSYSCKASCQLEFANNIWKQWDSTGANSCNSVSKSTTGFLPAVSNSGANVWAVPPDDITSPNTQKLAQSNYPIVKFEYNCQIEASGSCMNLAVNPSDKVSFGGQYTAIATFSTSITGQDVKLNSQHLTNGLPKSATGDFGKISADGKTVTFTFPLRTDSPSYINKSSATFYVSVAGKDQPACHATIQEQVNSTTPTATKTATATQTPKPTTPPDQTKVSVQKTGGVCVENGDGSSNLIDFSVTVFNPTSNNITVNKINDTLPNGFSYVANSATVNGVAIEPVSGVSNPLVWDNSGSGWVVNSKINLVLKFKAKAETSASIGYNTNNASIELTDQGTDKTLTTTYKFKVSTECTPQTGVIDQVFLPVSIAITMFFMAGYIMSNPYWKPAMMLSNKASIGLDNVKVNISQVDEFIQAKKDPVKGLEYKLKKYVKQSGG